MIRELFVVSVLKNSAWVDVTKFTDKATAFMVCDKLRSLELEAHVLLMRCTSANPSTLVRQQCEVVTRFDDLTP